MECSSQFFVSIRSHTAEKNSHKTASTVKVGLLILNFEMIRVIRLNKDTDLIQITFLLFPI